MHCNIYYFKGFKQRKSTANKSLVVTFIVVVVLFQFFGGWGVTGVVMNSGIHGGMNENGWMLFKRKS